MKRYLIILVAAVAALAASCGKQDTVYKQYVKNGGYIYPAKPINVTATAGYQRVILNWEAPMDPSLRTAKVFWNSNKESREFNYADYPEGKLKTIIEDLEDRAYTFNVVNYDAAGNKSLTVEVSITPFGDSWLVSHAERSIVSARMDAENENAVITMTKSTDEMVATKFRYTTQDGEEVEYSKYMEPEDREISLPRAMKGKKFAFKSGYLPEGGIDTVWTASWQESLDGITYQLDPSTWTIEATTGQVQGTYTPDKVFDGQTTGSGHYESSNNTTLRKIFPKILTIDTGAEGENGYALSGFSFFMNPAAATSLRYIRNVEVFVGDSPYDPDATAEEVAGWGDPFHTQTFNRNDVEQAMNFRITKTGRYIALVFPNSFDTNGRITLWELVPYGYSLKDIQ